MKRVTDLDKFSLEQIWRPYQNMHPLFLGRDRRFECAPLNLHQTHDELVLKQNSEWAKCVIDRICAIGFYFPEYIRHPLVDFIEHEQIKAKAQKSPPTFRSAGN